MENPVHDPAAQERYRQFAREVEAKAHEFDGKEATYETFMHAVIALEKWMVEAFGKEPGKKLEDETEAQMDAAAMNTEVGRTISDLLDLANQRVRELLQERTEPLQTPLQVAEALGVNHEHIDEVIIPPQDLEIQRGDGTGEWKEKRIEPRIERLLQELQRHKIFFDDLLTLDGPVAEDMMRSISYMVIQIPKIGYKEIVVCNQVGEATFVGQYPLGFGAYNQLKKPDIEAMPGMTRIICNDLGEWTGEVMSLLMQNQEPENWQKIDVEYVRRVRRAVISELNGAEWLAMPQAQRQALRFENDPFDTIGEKLMGPIFHQCSDDEKKISLAVILFGIGVPEVNEALDTLTAGPHTKEETPAPPPPKDTPRVDPTTGPPDWLKRGAEALAGPDHAEPVLMKGGKGVRKHPPRKQRKAQDDRSLVYNAVKLDGEALQQLMDAVKLQCPTSEDWFNDRGQVSMMGYATWLGLACAFGFDRHPRQDWDTKVLIAAMIYGEDDEIVRPHLIELLEFRKGPDEPIHPEVLHDWLARIIELLPNSEAWYQKVMPAMPRDPDNHTHTWMRQRIARIEKDPLVRQIHGLAIRSGIDLTTLNQPEIKIEMGFRIYGQEDGFLQQKQIEIAARRKRQEILQSDPSFLKSEIRNAYPDPLELIRAQDMAWNFDDLSLDEIFEIMEIKQLEQETWAPKPKREEQSIIVLVAKLYDLTPKELVEMERKAREKAQAEREEALRIRHQESLIASLRNKTQTPDAWLSMSRKDRESFKLNKKGLDEYARELGITISPVVSYYHFLQMGLKVFKNDEKIKTELGKYE